MYPAQQAQQHLAPRRRKKVRDGALTPGQQTRESEGKRVPGDSRNIQALRLGSQSEDDNDPLRQGPDDPLTNNVSASSDSRHTLRKENGDTRLKSREPLSELDALIAEKEHSSWLKSSGQILQPNDGSTLPPLATEDVPRSSASTLATTQQRGQDSSEIQQQQDSQQSSQSFFEQLNELMASLQEVFEGLKEISRIENVPSTLRTHMTTCIQKLHYLKELGSVLSKDEVTGQIIVGHVEGHDTLSETMRSEMDPDSTFGVPSRPAYGGHIPENREHRIQYLSAIDDIEVIQEQIDYLRADQDELLALLQNPENIANEELLESLNSLKSRREDLQRQLESRWETLRHLWEAEVQHSRIFSDSRTAIHDEHLVDDGLSQIRHPHNDPSDVSRSRGSGKEDSYSPDIHVRTSADDKQHDSTIDRFNKDDVPSDERISKIKLDLHCVFQKCEERLNQKSEEYEGLKNEEEQRHAVGARLSKIDLQTISSYPQVKEEIFQTWTDAYLDLVHLEQDYMMREQHSSLHSNTLNSSQAGIGPLLGVNQSMPNMFSAEIIGTDMRQRLFTTPSIAIPEHASHRDDFINVWLLHQLRCCGAHERKYCSELEKAWPAVSHGITGLPDLVKDFWFEKTGDRIEITPER